MKKKTFYTNARSLHFLKRLLADLSRSSGNQVLLTYFFLYQPRTDNILLVNSRQQINGKQLYHLLDKET